IFGRELLRALEADARDSRVHFVASENSLRVLAEELGLSGRTNLLEKLLDAPPPNRLGMGLPHVRRRLELRYGGAASMEACARAGVYRVELRFPCESPMASSSRA